MGTTKWWQDFLKADSVDSPGKWMNIQDVRVTNRLVNTPVALVTSQFGYSAKMEKAYASQGQDMTMSASKTLEINPDHPVIYEIYKKVKADAEDASAKQTAGLLTQAAILSSGYRLEDPSQIIASVQKLLKSRRNVDLNVEVKEVEIPAPADDGEDGADDADDAEDEDAE